MIVGSIPNSVTFFTSYIYLYLFYLLVLRKSNRYEYFAIAKTNVELSQGK